MWLIFFHLHFSKLSCHMVRGNWESWPLPGDPIRWGANTFFAIHLLSSLPLALYIWFYLSAIFNLHRSFPPSCQENSFVANFKRQVIAFTNSSNNSRLHIICPLKKTDSRVEKKCMHSKICVFYLFLMYVIAKNVHLYVSQLPTPYFNFRKISKNS